MTLVVSGHRFGVLIESVMAFAQLVLDLVGQRGVRIGLDQSLKRRERRGQFVPFEHAPGPGTARSRQPVATMRWSWRTPEIV